MLFFNVTFATILLFYLFLENQSFCVVLFGEKKNICYKKCSIGSACAFLKEQLIIQMISVPVLSLLFSSSPNKQRSIP